MTGRFIIIILQQAFLISTYHHRSTRLVFRLTFLVNQLVAESRSIPFWVFLNSKNAKIDDHSLGCQQPSFNWRKFPNLFPLSNSVNFLVQRNMFQDNNENKITKNKTKQKNHQQQKKPKKQPPKQNPKPLPFTGPIIQDRVNFWMMAL